MRRIDDGHAARPPPFRVLAAPDPNYLSPAAEPPPPPRAPEPYKVAPSTTSFARAHRRSSFVIIAESRPATPEARTPSPTLATGRVSPFRGRGFKGPPPRSKSRPQSPELTDSRRRFRNDRRVSVSQQNSPRRSLIPQPTRKRSISLTKTGDRSSSPKIGRRVDSRTRLNTTESKNRLNTTGNHSSTNSLVTRRPSIKAGNKLSPIQGTPTKAERNTPLARRNDRTRDVTRAPLSKISRSSPVKNAGNQRRVGVQDKGKEKLGSPSRIPLKTNRNTTNSLNPPRFITLPNQSSDKANRKVERAIQEVSDEQKSGQSGENGATSDERSKESQENDKSATSSEKTSDLDLREILKLSSGATGTSSVVNTTTATATQPLHIDANTVLVEKLDNGKKANTDQNKIDAEGSVVKSSNSPKTNDNASSNKQSQSTTDEQKAQNQTSKPSKPGSSYSRTKIATDSKTNSPIIGENGHAKTNSISQSAKVLSRINGMGSGSATHRRTPNESVLKNSKSVEVKTQDEVSTVQSVSASTVRKSGEAELVETETVASSSNREKNQSGAESNDSKTLSRVTSNRDLNIVSTTSMITNDTSVVTMSNSNSLSNNNNAMGAVNNRSEVVNSSGSRVRNENRGSNTSLKSSAGVSNNSIESARSTDTGVSVNTVRGVSSPREKSGVHVVKREQEIETLSGNIMHLEQNGEPALLAANPTAEEQQPERLLARWKKSLDRFGKRCPNMRCLACRTDPKGLSWFKNNAKINKPIAKTRAKVEEQSLPENTRSAVKTGCWSRLKNRCRCNRMREMKCCTRKARVAPAESTSCCPPERRFGAICRRVFDRCKCKRAEPERTRNVRAKHSLTSVAPPPLSEEPKAKIPDVLVEHNSLMRGAIPCLPVPLAWFCLVWNVLLPGSGTVWSGIFNLCTGQPRFSQVAGLKSRLGAFVVNLVVGVGQLFTVLFCLVGWGWSIWWGVTLVRLARKYRRFKASEAASNDPEARGGDGALPPGVPSQALREVERAR